MSLTKFCFSTRSLDDSGLSATPRCTQPINAPQCSDVMRRHDNSSPSSTSSSSHESGIKSTTDSSSPEHRHDEYHHQWPCQQQQYAHAATAGPLSTPADVPLDLSVTSSSPWQRINDDEVTGVRRHPVTSSRRHGNDRQLSTLSVVDDRLPLLSNAHCAVTSRDVTCRHGRCHNPLSALSFADKSSPLLSNGQWLLQPPPPPPVPLVFAPSPRYSMPPVQHAATESDASVRLPESAKLLLTSWYETHIRHPYPQPDELSQLVMMTGQSKRKILKWLANRRARTGNTLPHNGSVHPRKIIKIRQLRQQADEVEPNHDDQAARRGSRQRSSRFLPEPVVDGLQRWYSDHLGYPYPTDAEKRQLAEQLGTTVVKVTNWFANKRNRSGHGRSGSVRGHMTSFDGQSMLMASQVDWRHSLMCLPRSLSSSSSLVTARHWNHQGLPS